MSKYIIKNCPAFIDFDEQSLTENKCNAHGKYNGDCCNISDCVLKQIVELAKGHTELCKNCEQQIKECDCSDICNAYRLNKILQLLEIKEVE